MNEDSQIIEIILPDGTTCNPWVEDCPVGTDGDSYGTQIALIGKNAAILYGAFAMLSALIPSVFWFADRQPKVDALKKNDLYWWTWLSLWLGHLILYGFPGLFWPISFAAMPLFNTVFVMWQ